MSTPRIAHTRRMSGEERREQILDVTKGIVGLDGFHAVTIDRVAREAGITRPVVYGHFTDLRGLLNALVERESRRALLQLRDMLAERLEGSGSVSALVGALEGYLAAVSADPVTWRLVLMSPEGAPALLRERIEQGRAAIVSLLAEVAAPALGPGSPDPELTARTMSALADESARLLLTDPQRFPAERLVAHARWLLGAIGSSQ